MPIFDLSNKIAFPDPQLADRSGIIAIGGDLSPGRLLQAYKSGIFPWFNEGDPIVWWSPDPRMVLYPDDLKISRSMKKILDDCVFEVTFDKDFESVIHACKEQKRMGQKGTWITQDMEDAYLQLHHMGYAHSVEVWYQGTLAGGLYGISLGGLFAGESMFTKVSNASKTGFIFMVQTLKHHGIRMIDCQVFTPHLESLGGNEISRKKFLAELSQCLYQPTMKGNWGWMLQKTS